MQVFKSMSRSKKPTTTAISLPPNWPSPLHNKCDEPRCKHPNPPQVAAGKYDCRGLIDSFEYCEGHYYVSLRQAEAAHDSFKAYERERKARLELERQAHDAREALLLDAQLRAKAQALYSKRHQPSAPAVGGKNKKAYNARLYVGERKTQQVLAEDESLARRAALRKRNPSPKALGKQA